MFYKSYQLKNKYNNVKTHGYDSMKEANRGFELELLVKAKEIKDLQKQTKIELLGENKGKICVYKADFTYYDKDGAWVIEDVKSSFTASMPVFRIKWKMVEDKYREEIKLGKVKLLLTY